MSLTTVTIGTLLHDASSKPYPLVSICDLNARMFSTRVI